MSDNETTADIVEEMRQGFDKSWHHIDREWAHGLSDRIEAAAKRERLWRACEAEVNFRSPVPDGPTGNAAAIREALTKVSEWMAHRIATGGFEASPTLPTVLEGVVLPALAAPPRNCDVGTAEEQSERFVEFCDEEKGNREHCRNCRLCNAQDCELTWAQMPYKKEETDGSN